jgi:hypothetical protein
MKNYIVSWMEKVNGKLIERYCTFIEDNDPSSKEEAEEFYNKLLEREEVYTANLSLIIQSTDY